MGLARVNLVLAGVVALLTLVVLFGPQPDTPLPEAPLTMLEPDNIRHILIDRRGQKPIAFERGADGWGMTAPYRIAADGGKLQALARIASTPSHRSFPAAQADLAELGLVPVPLSLKLDDLTLEIGGTEPIRRDRYVHLDGRIHLVDDLFQHHLLAAAETFVAPTPFPTAIQSATLDGAPLTAQALLLLSNVQARKVERDGPPGGGHWLEFQIEGTRSPLRFSLEPEGKRLWREQPPLLYRLETPVTPDLLRK